MKKAFVCIGVVTVLLLAVMPVAAITWGKPDTEHTNVGAMMLYYTGYGLWQTCTGTLIHPQVVLTAGHCTDGVEDDPDIEWVGVNFHENALNKDTVLLVEQVITHPEYAWGGSDPHDVGLLVLAAPVEDIEPAPLPYEGFLDELKRAKVLRPGGPEAAKFTLVGYGGTLNWPPPDIYYEDMRQFAESEYASLTPVWLHMSQLALKGDGGTCFGDSGGPAFWKDEEGTETVVGVTSWGDAQCVATSFNYRIDIPTSLSFIYDVMDGLEE